MKRLVLIALLLTAWAVPAAAHDVKKISKADLVKRDGLFYEKFSNTPFTGKTTTGWYRATYKNGRLHGVLEVYGSNGQLMTLAALKDGLYHGKTVTYYPDGKRWEEIMYKSDLKDGPYVA